MADKLGEQIVKEWERERGKQSNTLSLWQKTGDAIYPYVQITAEFMPGTDRMAQIWDVTPMQDAKKMVAGFKQVLIPSGQTFFDIKVHSRHANNDRVQRYLSYLTEAAHEEIFASNFMTKIDDVLTSWIVFGIGAMYRDAWTPKNKLNFRYANVGSYVLFEDRWANIIGSIHRFKMTAIEAYQLYGNAVGKSVIDAANNPQKEYDEFWFLYKVMPREVNPKLSKDIPSNRPIGAWVVNEKEKCTVEESGFQYNPYAIGRWSRPENEKDGRGVGTEILPQVDILFRMTRQYLECADKYNNPPRQALADSVEGELRTFSGAINWVNQIDAVRAMDMSMNGNFPVTEKTLERQTQIIHEAFYRNAFDPLEQLTGDRRTTLEIQERIRGTLKHLGPPAGRIWKEFLSPLIEGTVLDLISNHVVEPPPEELAGDGFGVEYVGPLALTLKSEQTRGFTEWVALVGQASAQFPEKNLGDNIDFDDAIPRMGRTLGVNHEDITTSEERQQIREARQQMLEQQQQMQMAMAAAKGYKDASGSAEPGSPAEAMMAGAG